MPSSNFSIVSLPQRADDPVAGDQSYFRAHAAETSYTRTLSHAERTSAGQLPPGCTQVRVHRLGTATALPAVHLREFLPGPSADWRTRSTPAAQPATRRFGVVNVPTDDRAALLALRQFLLALP